jgi:hypothetical protein
MATAKPQNDYRFSFLLQLACHLQLPDDVFITAMATTSGAALMVFAQSAHISWLHVSVDSNRAGLNRKFFSGATCRGFKLLLNNGFSSVETPLAQIDSKL